MRLHFYKKWKKDKNSRSVKNNINKYSKDYQIIYEYSLIDPDLKIKVREVKLAEKVEDNLLIPISPIIINIERGLKIKILIKKILRRLKYSVKLFKNLKINKKTIIPLTSNLMIVTEKNPPILTLTLIQMLLFENNKLNIVIKPIQLYIQIIYNPKKYKNYLKILNSSTSKIRKLFTQ